METFKQLEGVAIADAENVTINYNGDLTATFIDWQENPLKLVFNGTLGFRVGPFFDDIPRDDCAYEVTNSMWFNKHKEVFRKAEGISLEELEKNYHHYKLSFNAMGDYVIDVIAASYEVSA